MGVIPPPHSVLVPLAWGHLFKNSVLLRVLCGEKFYTPSALRARPPIIMVFASVLRKNRFIKVISFNDSKHSCYYLGP